MQPPKKKKTTLIGAQVPKFLLQGTELDSHHVRSYRKISLGMPPSSPPSKVSYPPSTPALSPCG